MPNDKKVDPVVAFEADHGETVEKWKTGGLDAGVKQERERFAALHKEFDSRPDFVCEQFASGNDVDKAKAEFSGVLEGELAEERKKTAKLQAEIDTFSDGDDGVSHHGGTKKKEVDRMELSAEDRATHDWACDFEGCKAAYADNFDGYKKFVVEEQRHMDRDKK